MSQLLRRNDERQEVKHLIIFLGYSQSRISHPVYRQFVQAPIARRNASLLFLPRALEERELVHEINALRKRGNQMDELSFHICATLGSNGIGEQVVETATMIRRVYECPSYVYGLLPELDKVSDDQRKRIWNDLAAINNGVNEYPELQLISHCFLYHDDSQKSLASFLYNVTQHPESIDILERCGYLGKLVSSRKTGDVSYTPEFPAVFSTFNAADISYPEEEIRYYIHQNYLNALLALSRPETNPVSMERCNEHVSQIINQLPLSKEQVSLLGDHFMETNNPQRKTILTAEATWQQNLEKELANLEDRPREEWLNHLRNGMEIQYRSRYRDMGVEYYYKQQKGQTTNYVQILLKQLKEGVRQIMRNFPYPPETSQDIVRSMVNYMQQLALSFTNQQTELEQEIKTLKEKTQEQNKTWDDMGFFDRMRGKDKILLEEYKPLLLRYYVARTELQGASFAVKLLNELIPLVAALNEHDAQRCRLCQETYEATNRYIEDNRPEVFIPKMFDPQPVCEAALAIRQDKEALQKDYREFQQLLYSEALTYADADNLLMTLRDYLTDRIDEYIQQRMEQGTLPAILGVPVTERLKTVYAEQGGLKELVDQLKKETALSLQLKQEGRHNEQYLLISPKCDEIGPYIRSKDFTSLHMLHILASINLTELDGFSGQRMFVEPSIF